MITTDANCPTGQLSSVDRRRKSIRNGAALFALSFMLPWIPISQGGASWVKGIHLTLSLAFYDSMYTYVLLAQSALFADMTSNQAYRSIVLRYGQVASFIGTSVIFIAFIIYDQHYLFPFRTLTFMVAIISWFLLRYSARHACKITEGDEGKSDEDKKTDQLKSEKTSSSEKGEYQPRSAHSFWGVTWQVIKQKNFLFFVAMNFLQVFDVTVSSNFFVIYERNLLGADAWPKVARTVIVSASFLLPQVFVISVAPLVTKHGSYRVIM